MMASHRPADQPAAPPPDPDAPELAPAPAPAGKATLPPSNFLVGFDWVLALGVLALAFLIASFAVRNSDFWMHLATGRLLAEGNYQFGKDPFSHVGGDRTWVNHAWLFDWLLFLVYKVSAGPGVVIAKASAVAATAGLLLLCRRPGQSVFPAATCAGLALVAAAPRLFLQPTIATFLFLAALMALLIRVPRRPGSWLVPGLVAGLFWLWANCDQWFFLGPAILLLYTVGQYAGERLGVPYFRPDEEEHLPTLWKALGLGVVACMLNPHHVRVWALPAELVDGRLRDVFAKDEIGRLFNGAFGLGGLDFSGSRGNWANAYALLALVLLAVIGFVVNRRRASAGLALVFLGLVVLALMHVRAVPFLAFVAAPIAAVNLAAAGRRLADTPLPDGTVRTLHALRSGGRAAVGMVGLLLLCLTYPGWVHPPSLQARWKWDLEPDPSLERSAKKIHEWRTAGTLPPDARLLNLHPDFAGYVAWYAPGTRSFFDMRLGFHEQEAAEYVALRRHLALLDPRDRRQDPFDLPEFLRKYDITYLVTAHPMRTENRITLAALWGDGSDAGAGPDWVLWDLQGRAVTLGWARQRAVAPATVERLRFDPLRVAFAEATLLPGPAQPLQPPTPPTDIWERFLVPPPTAPVEAEEAFVLTWYRQTLLERAAARHQRALQSMFVVAQTRLMTPALTVWTGASRDPRLTPTTVPPEVTAVALLAVRAARRAVLASPDHPDGYFFLAKTYADSTHTSTGDIQELVASVNLARAHARLPADPAERRATFEVLDLLDPLFGGHTGASPPRFDLALDTLQQAIVYQRLEIEEGETRATRLPADLRDRADAELEERRKQLAGMERRATQLEGEVKTNLSKYVIAASGQTSPLDRAAVARRFGLVKEAIVELRRAHEQFQKDLGARGANEPFPPSELALHLAVHAELIELLWFEGKVEESAQILDTVDTAEVLRVMDAPPVRQEHARIRQRATSLMFPDPRQRRPNAYEGDPAGHFRILRRALSLAVGDFERAVEGEAHSAQTIRDQLADYRARNFPGDIPDIATLPDPMAIQREVLSRPILLPVNFARLAQIDKLHTLRRLSQMRVESQLRLGLTRLEWGDVTGASSHFRQALDAPGWFTPLPQQGTAREYLRAIERATAGKGAGS